MKKLFAVILALCLLLSLAACGKTEPTEAPTEAAPEATTEAPTEAPTEPATEEEELSPAVGVVTGNSYINTVLGISCDLNEEWTVLDEQGIADVYGYTLENFTDDKLKSAMESAGSLIVYYALRNEGMESLNISITSSSLFGYLEGSESQLVELIIPQLESALPGTGIEPTSIEAATITFAGQERHCINVVGTISGVTIYEKQVIICNGDYMFTVTAASCINDTCDELMGSFVALAE